MNLGNAQDRASLALQIAQYLCSIENIKVEDASESADNDAAMKKTIELIREFAQPVDIEEQEHNGTYHWVYNLTFAYFREKIRYTFHFEII